MLKKRNNYLYTIFIILSVLLFLMFLFLLISSLFHTTVINIHVNPAREWVEYHSQNPFFWCSLLILFLIALVFISPKIRLESISEKKILVALIAYLFILGCLYIFNSKNVPTFDSAHIIKSAINLSHNQYAILSQNYLQRCPHQLGIILFVEIIARFVDNFLVPLLMLLNVIFICIIHYFLYKSSQLLIKQSTVRKVCLLVYFLFLPSIFYPAFIYGTIPGLMFASISIYFLLKYFEKAKPLFIIFSFISIFLAIICKSNFQIFLIAMLIIIIVTGIQASKVKYYFIALLFTLSFLGPGLVQSFYTLRSGVTFNKPIPSISYIAMGMQPGLCGPGWYNDSHNKSYNKNHGNIEQIKVSTKLEIKNRILEFFNNPLDGVVFYYKKIISQWNEPTFQSLWLASYQEIQINELNGFMKSLYYGNLNKTIILFMKFVCLVIWLGNLMDILFSFKTRTIESRLFQLIILGGFFFHILWEGKALYIYPYILFAIPYAVTGYAYFLKSRIITDLKFNKYIEFNTKKS